MHSNVYGILAQRHDPMRDQHLRLSGRQLQRTTINEAIAVWNSETLLRLIPHVQDEANFVEFMRATNKCRSDIGMIGGRQEIACEVGSDWGKWAVVADEIGHTFGLWHEQQRLDRDRWVTPYWSNIIEDEWDQYEVFELASRDICEYDYDSIMHYGCYSNAKDDAEPTLEPKVSGVSIGQRDHLSWRDKAAVQFVHGIFSLRNACCRIAACPSSSAQRTSSPTAAASGNGWSAVESSWWHPAAAASDHRERAGRAGPE